MFKKGDIVKVLIPNVINTGYDYRLIDDADVGNFVRCTVMNRQYIGVIIGTGDSGLDNNKIKPVIEVCNLGKLSQYDIDWIYRMSQWTLMTPGAVLRLILNIPDAFNPSNSEKLYTYNFDSTCKMTDARQRIIDAFQSNDNDAMSVSDIQNIANVNSSVIKGLIKNNTLIQTDVREKKSNDFVYKYYDTGNVELNS